MNLQCANDFGRQAACDFLRNLRVRRIPFFGLRFHSQFDRVLVISADFLQRADVDFPVTFQEPLWWTFNVLAEQIPMLCERGERQAADGRVLSFKQTGSGTLAIPFIGANCACNVLLQADWHCSGGCQLFGNVSGLRERGDTFNVV